jgi:hypothetical protein
MSLFISLCTNVPDVSLDGKNWAFDFEIALIQEEDSIE